MNTRICIRVRVAHIYVRMGMCVCTHHHFIIHLPHSRVFHSHRHVSGLVWLSSCSVRRPSNGRYSCSLAMIITIITIIRRRDAAQPKNHHRQPSSSSPVALAPPLRFLHLLLLLLFLLPHTVSFLSPLLVGASSAVPLVRQKSSLAAPHDEFSRSPATLIGELSRERKTNTLLARSLYVHTYVRTYVRKHAHMHAPDH